MWSSLIWISVETSCGLLWTRQWALLFHKIWVIAWLANRVAVVQEKFCFIELVSSWISRKLVNIQYKRGTWNSCFLTIRILYIIFEMIIALIISSNYHIRNLKPAICIVWFVSRIKILTPKLCVANWEQDIAKSVWKVYLCLLFNVQALEGFYYVVDFCYTKCCRSVCDAIGWIAGFVSLRTAK